jgi:hypothetical protein
LKVITSSGYQYFTFSQGITCSELRIDARFDDANQQLVIKPSFTIENAKGTGCHAVAYFYDDRGVPLKDLNDRYNTRDGTVAATVDFSPGFSPAAYNNTQTDFTINLPYSELHLPPGRNRFQYKIVLFDEKWNRVITSKLFAAYLGQ